MVIFASAIVLADGGFYGSVTYKNCECTTLPKDNVEIYQELSNQSYFCHVQCNAGQGSYNTRVCDPPHVYPPGWYVLHVAVSRESNCWGGHPTPGIPVRVYHGLDWQEVNLVVEGPTPKPRDGDD